METFTKNAAALNPEGCYFADALPEHIAYAHVRRTDKGTWCIKLTGYMHPKSNMPPAHDTLYIPGNMNGEEAIRKAAARVHAKFTTRQEGSNLVWRARKLLPSITDRRFVQNIADNLFGDWLYKDTQVTGWIDYGVNLVSCGAWTLTQYASVMRQMKINREVK